MFLTKEITKIDSELNFYVDLRPHLDVCLKYEPWEKGLNVYRLNSFQWHYEKNDPNINLLNTIYSEYPDLPVCSFTKRIPSKFHKLVSRFSYLQTTILQWNASLEVATDLFFDNPILLWILAHLYHCDSISMKECKKILHLKPIDILKSISSGI